MEYGNILKAAWQATWKHKAMWLLGMAIIGGSHIGLTQFSYNGGTDYRTDTLLDALGELVQEYWVLVMLIALCLLLLILTAYVFHYIALGGMYRGAALAKAEQPVQFAALCRAGTETFWLVLAAALLFKIAIGALMLLLVTGLVLLALTIVGLVIVIPLIIILLCLALPARSISASLYSFTIQGIVLQHLGIHQSWQQAWQLWKAHWLDTLLIYLILVGWKVLVSLVCLVGLVLLALPVALLGYLAYTSQAWLVLGLGALVLVGSLTMVAFLIKGISQSFSAHLWHRCYAALAQR